VYDYYGRLALGSHLFPGSALHANLLNEQLGTAGIGAKDVSIPVKEIQPQGLSKTMTATQGSSYTWGVSKDSSPVSAVLHNTCDPGAPHSAAATITVTWTRSAPSPTGDITVVTTITVTNPAHRAISASVSDTVYSGATALDTHDFAAVSVAANSTRTLTNTVTVPSGPTNLHDVATAHYTDDVTHVAVPGTTTATASAAVETHNTFNQTATIRDVESITGSGLSFSADSVTGAPANSSFTAPANYIGGHVTSLSWQSGTIDPGTATGDQTGTITFNKTVYVDGARDTTGALSDTATLVDSAGNTRTANAHTDITTTSDCATVEVTKVVVGGDAGDSFGFTTTGLGSAFHLVDGQTKTITPVAPNNGRAAYTVVEDLTAAGQPAGYNVTDVSCVTTDDSTPDSDSSGALNAGHTVGTATIHVSAGETVHCTVTNTHQATVTVTKVTDPASDPATFAFTSTGAGLGSPTLDTNPATEQVPDHQTYTLSAGQFGQHSFTEGPAEGWRLTGVDCSGVDETVTDRTASFNVAAGAQINCTYTNTKDATVKIHKVVVGGSDEDSFDFTPSSSLDSSHFQLHGGDTKTYANVVPNSDGDYTVAEAAVNGYRLTSVSCDDGESQTPSTGTVGNRTAIINAEPGETVECTFTNQKVDAGLLVVKDGAPPIVHDGDKVTFTYNVTNPGTGPVTIDGISDNKCSPIGSAKKLTPTSSTDRTTVDATPGTLDPGDLWIYTCTTPAQHTDETPNANCGSGSAIVNTVVVGATDEFGNHLTDNDQHATCVIHPGIAVDKTGPATAQAGDKVAYTLTVTNTGDTGLAASTVKAADEACNGDAVTLTGTGGDTTPESLDRGDVWTYNCSVQTAVGQTSVHNVATVTGCDQLDGCVNGQDTADTTLSQPGQLVLPERIIPGKARLLGPTGCVARAFNARVRGSKMATVVFKLDGKVIKRVRNTKNAALVSLRINPAKFKVGVHRLAVTVTFRAGSGTKKKTMRLSFQRCAKKLVAPHFTG
jgi:hypothetical protein